MNWLSKHYYRLSAAFKKLVKKRRISPWNNFFYVANVYIVLAAAGQIACAVLMEKSETTTSIGLFNLHITHLPCLLYYTVSGCMLAASVLGLLAPWLNKPSLWDVYCIIMGVSTAIELALAGNTMNKIGNDVVLRAAMSSTMQEYGKAGTDVAKIWDTLHTKHKCCGIESYTEWQDVPYGRTTLRTPKSCCLPPNNDDDLCSLNVLPDHEEADKIVYTGGCLEIIVKPLDETLRRMGLYGLAIGSINAFYMALTCFLVASKKM